VSDVNPYASPLNADPVVATVVDEIVPVSNVGIWRDGDLLVMHRDARLPDRCVKSNQPALGYRLRRFLHWYHPAVYFTLLIGPLIFILVALVVQKKAVIEIGLSERWRAKRIRATIVGWGVALLSCPVGCCGLAWMYDKPAAGWLIVLAFFLFLLGAIYGSLAARMVAPKRISNEHIWLKGVHPQFLDELPPLPY